jgi:hypothetical protein
MPRKYGKNDGSCEIEETDNKDYIIRCPDQPTMRCRKTRCNDYGCEIECAESPTFGRKHPISNLHNRRYGQKEKFDDDYKYERHHNDFYDDVDYDYEYEYEDESYSSGRSGSRRSKRNSFSSARFERDRIDRDRFSSGRFGKDRSYSGRYHH